MEEELQNSLDFSYEENKLSNFLNNISMGNQSNFFDEDPYVPYHERLETYIVPILFAIIFIIGVLGNGTLILIFIRHRNMRNVPNMYICSLAVGDILVILFCVPFTSTVYTVDSWPYGVVVCKFSEFIKDVSIGVSVFTLTALSADRYFAIVDPMRKLAGRRATKVTCLTIAGIWIISIIISLPSALFSYIKKFNDTDHSFLVCYPFPEEFGDAYAQIMVLFKALVYYFVPLILIASFYIVMAHHLVLSTQNMPGEAQGQGRQIQGRKKVAKMVLSFVVIFAMCFFLSHVFLLWFYFSPNSVENFNLFWHVVRILGFCLSFLNSCINPITLYCVSGTFRKHFNHHLLCCFFPHPSSSRSQSSFCTHGRMRLRPSRLFKQSRGNSRRNSETSRQSPNGLRRAHSTLTSSTSVRTQVIWDPPTPEQKKKLEKVLQNKYSGQGALLQPPQFHIYKNPRGSANSSPVESFRKRRNDAAEINPNLNTATTSFIENKNSLISFGETTVAGSGV